MAEVRQVTSTHPEGYIHAIACGGDGTVVWLIEELIKAKVDLKKVIVGFLPFGTGNDYSVATGFGRKLQMIISADLPNILFENPFKGLKYVVRRFLASKIQKIDIWDIEIACHEEVNLSIII